MATLSKQANGSWKLYFVHPQHGRRTSVTLGKLPKRAAQTVRLRVEQLLACHGSGTPWPPELAEWVGTLDQALRQKLARVGLVDARPQVTLGEFLQQWLESRKHYKATSQDVWRQVVQWLLEFYGPQCPMHTLDHARGEAFRQHMLSCGLADSTINKRLQTARMMFQDAVRQGLLDKNPLEHVRHHGGDPATRRVYVPVEVVEKVLEACPDVWWRLLVVLARFAGLRVPSEPFSLRWEDIHWAAGRLLVTSSKTAHLAGRGYRAVPLFPELRPYLEQAWQQAPEGAEYVFPDPFRRRGQGSSKGANLRTQMVRIIRRAGVEPWPRPFQNLRASCETDLVQRFPLPKVVKWIGNTTAVAMRHYVDVTDEDFRRAAATGLAPEKKQGAALPEKQTGTAPAKETAPGPGEKTGAQLGAQSAAFEGNLADLEENQLTSSPLDSTPCDSGHLRSPHPAEVHGNRTHRLHVFRTAQRF